MIDSHWEKIAGLMPGRTMINCKEKLFSLVPSRLIETPWTLSEEEILLDIIENEEIK